MPPDTSLVPVFSRSLGSWHLSIGRHPYGPGELASHYDRKSPGWHATLDRYGFEQAYADLLARVLRQPRYRQSAPDLRVLDAGLGTGAMASAFRTLIGRRFRLDGVDISPAMLRQADQRLRSRDIDVTLAQADLTALPYDDNSFDIALVAHVLEHLANPNAAIAELNRVLKPGGVLICCMTRRSAVGACIQVLWRTHQVAIGSALRWLRGGGLVSVRAIPLDRHSATRRFSIGYVGRKPALA